MNHGGLGGETRNPKPTKNHRGGADSVQTVWGSGLWVAVKGVGGSGGRPCKAPIVSAWPEFWNWGGGVRGLRIVQMRRVCDQVAMEAEEQRNLGSRPQRATARSNIGDTLNPGHPKSTWRFGTS